MKDKQQKGLWLTIALFWCLFGFMLVLHLAHYHEVRDLRSRVTELEEAIDRIETATDKMVEAIREYEEAR